MIPRWLRRLIGFWKADGVSPLWLKQRAQEDSKAGDPPIFINWQAMKDLNRE